MKYRNFDIYAIRRSGHHAIIFWIINNLGGFTHKLETFMYWNPHTGVYYYNDCADHLYPFVNKYNYMIRNYEDAWETYGSPIPQIFSKRKNKSITIPIIIMRDFINLYASRAKKNTFNNLDIDSLIILWKQQAKAIIEKKAFGILYNKWLVDKKYRDLISAKLGIPNKYDNIDYVPEVGQGGSFSSLKLEKDRQNYLKRYQMVDISEDIIDKILNDKELVELNKKLFNINLKSIEFSAPRGDSS